MMSLTFDQKKTTLKANIQDRFVPSRISPKYIRGYICDFIELYAVFYQDKLNKSEVIDLFDDHGFNLATIGEAKISSLPKSEVDDIKEQNVREIFELLCHRSFIGNGSYPFEVDSSSIKLNFDSRLAQKVYLQQLLSSQLDVFSEFEADLTTDFERITCCSLSKMLSSNVKIKAFGKNTSYVGNAREKIKALAADIGLKTKDENINKIPLSNNQERGVDVVAWQSFGDAIGMNILLFLVQCACGKKWADKGNEVLRYRNYFHMPENEMPIRIIAVPYSLATPAGFEMEDDVVRTESLLLDRFRIVEFIDEDVCLSEDILESFLLVDAIINDPQFIRF